MQTFSSDHQVSSLLASFEQILLSNSGEDAFEIAIKLISAKLVDEIEVQDADRAPLFVLHESAELTLDAVQALYKRAITRWPTLSNGVHSLEIDAPHLIRAIRPLLGWKLIGSDLSILDTTLERLVAKGSKGALGQYFTPRDIIRLCVDVLNPSSNDTIIDPACGSGGFLFESLQHCLKLGRSLPTCLGIDFSSKSIKVATLMSAAIAEHPVQVFNGNSLDGRAYANSTHREWQAFLGNIAGSKTVTAESWGEWNKLGCSLLLTNPPFAGDIDDTTLLSAYDAQDSSKRSVSREHLFLERAVDLLKPGGRLAIVVPQGLLSNSSSSYLRSWLFRKCRILGVIGLHSYSFQPHTGVKTAILFLSKYPTGQNTVQNYPVFFATSNLPGKDSSGRRNGNSDYPQIAEAFNTFLRKQGLTWANDVQPSGLSPILHAEVMLSEIQQADRLDAEHFNPASRALQRRLLNSASSTIGEEVESKLNRFKKRDYKKIYYADIGSVDGRSGLIFPEAIDADDAPSRAAYIVEPGDILVSTVRPERNVVALVTESLELPTIASNGFSILRSKELQPELLFAYCKSKAFKELLSMHATASMYPTVSDKDVLSVPFCRPTSLIEANIIEEIRTGFQLLKDANDRIQKGIALMESYIDSIPASGEKL